MEGFWVCRRDLSAGRVQILIQTLISVSFRQTKYNNKNICNNSWKENVSTKATKNQINYRRREEERRMAELEQQRERENKRKEKQLQKLRQKEQFEISHKIRAEEKKLLIAQRKLESIRLLEALYDRIKVSECLFNKV